MAVVVKDWAGSPVPYHFLKWDNSVATSGTIVVTHAPDPYHTRQVRVINMATGAEVVIGAATVSIVHTNDTTTTVTNLAAAAANLLVIVTVQP